MSMLQTKSLKNVETISDTQIQMRARKESPLTYNF